MINKTILLPKKIKSNYKKNSLSKLTKIGKFKIIKFYKNMIFGIKQVLIIFLGNLIMLYFI